MANIRTLVTLILTFLLSMLLSACGTTAVSAGLIEKPEQPATAVRIVYADSQLSTGKDSDGKASISLEALSMLHRVGYFEIGEKIKKVAPPLLTQHGVWSDVVSMHEEAFISGGHREVKSNYSGTKPLWLLFLYFKNGQATNYGGTGVTANLQVIFKDAETNKTYWKGEYRNAVKKTPFGGKTFDEEFVNEMLKHIFSDMVLSELIPPAQQYASGAAPVASRP